MNAEEVRTLMPKSVEEIIEEITLNCAEEAKKGNFKYSTWEYDFGKSIKSDKKQKKIIEELINLGFKASHDVSSGQFMNPKLIVSWEVEE
ncbi:hypothetical protein MFLO_15880 [Listeria floridensis FSL S10-1187]|uniref:Uncharacterized protein n=1 Tax=Listeria floridensis FSL S10-1187 TaxID=1265817 RepID=A0ABN0RB94_9LIST|nr:hypothetical protein [Listeria floridensis]EUJ23494.1 hypothetical protein MFLO_15880 [Listeria floridensis FSL S10-1187]